MRPSKLLEELETRAKKELFERLKKTGKDTLNPGVVLNTLKNSGIPVLERSRVANHYLSSWSEIEITLENVHQILEPIEVFLRLLVELES